MIIVIFLLLPRKNLQRSESLLLKAASQALQKLPFGDCTVNNIKFVNFEKKEDCTFDLVKFFCSKYSNLLKHTPAQMDRLHVQEEFLDY